MPLELERAAVDAVGRLLDSAPLPALLDALVEVLGRRQNDGTPVAQLRRIEVGRQLRRVDAGAALHFLAEEDHLVLLAAAVRREVNGEPRRSRHLERIASRVGRQSSAVGGKERRNHEDGRSDQRTKQVLDVHFKSPLLVEVA
jgi:hypothetical protein